VRGLDVSEEVAELVGEQNLRLLAEQVAYGGYTCTICERASTLAERPASVVVFYGVTVTAVKIAHASCSRSRVIDAELDPATDIQATAVAGVFPSATELGARPVLLVEMGMIDVAPGRERVDGVIREILAQGLHLISQIDGTPPFAVGWTVTLSAPEGVRVMGPGQLVYDGTASRPDGWEQVVAALGNRCELFVGVNIRLAEGLGDDLHRLRDASRAGLLAGGSVAVRFTG
jgi:hypothetical protein